jgi:hypothetical protein
MISGLLLCSDTVNPSNTTVLMSVRQPIVTHIEHNPCRASSANWALPLVPNS